MIRLLRHLIPSNVLTLLFTEVVLIFSCYVVASFLVLEVDPVVYLLYDGGFGRISLTVLTIVLALYFHDLYSEIRVRGRMLLVQQALQVIGIAFLAQALLGYVNPALILPRWIMVLGSGFSLVALVSWRIFYSAVVLRALGETRIVFLGGNDLVGEIAQYLAEHSELGTRAVGYIDDQARPEPLAGGLERLGGLAELRSVVERVRADRIIVGMQERRGRMPLMDLLEVRFSGIQIEEAATAYENTFKRVSLRELRPSQLIYARELGPRPGNVVAQLVYSSLIALLGVIVCIPVMLLVAVAIKLSSRGPVLLRQTRVGWQGNPFALYKFRSMYADAKTGTGAAWAAKDDPRVTPVGRWLRRLRLDELPQFFNVLRGEMSIVGPRPERPEFFETLAHRIPFYRQRLCVKPGITGWAQINNNYGDSMEDAARRIEYDLYYIKNLSPAMDAFIIFHTFKTMLLSRGAQ
jgi:exopolysaccharide biosynthesis polyprenyl glycosylphosphotransferase